MSSIAIIGSGSVGSTIAYTLMLKNCTSNIILIDINEKRCRGEILDLSDSLLQSKVAHLTIGSFADAKHADIIIIAAGARQQPGQTRISLLDTNKKIIQRIISEISPLKDTTCMIMVTNPVDILTHVAVKLSGLPTQQIFGSGTILEGVRVRNLLAQKLAVCPASIHTYILGEHGPSQFPAWSISAIGGIPIEKFSGINKNIMDECAKEAANRVYEIIECKGATYYGVTSAVVTICENIIFDRKQLLPLSCYVSKFDTCLSIPVIIGAKGIERTLETLLSVKEQEALTFSALKIKQES